MLITIIVLIMSVVVHEVSHGVAAWYQGDTTARDAGRLTLNPLKHLDWFGSVLLPLVLVLSKASFFFAWAKPVPINPGRLHDRRYGELKVALAGPLSNLLLAVIFAIIGRILLLTGNYKPILVAYFQDSGSVLPLISGSVGASLYLLTFLFVLINLALAFFNLLPIPPLDGSRILYPFLPARAQLWFDRLEASPWSVFILLALVYSGLTSIILWPISYLFQWLVLR